MKKRHERWATIPSASLVFPAESGIAISRFRPETEKTIDPIDPVNPVQYKNYNSVEPTNSYDDPNK